MPSADIRSAARTAFGRHEGEDALSLMRRASFAALDEAGLTSQNIDGVLTGYAMTYPHLMLANVLAEQLAITPRYCHAVQLGGATGSALVQLAALLVSSGTCESVLVAAGDVRLTGAQKADITQTLAGVAEPDIEAPHGLSVPGYYGLLASGYLHDSGAKADDLAALAVLMRANAAQTPGAHLTKPITEADVLSAPVIADPLTRLSCCPISDGAAALIISAAPGDKARLRIAGAGQAHRHQHISAMDWHATGAKEAADRAFAAAGADRDDVDLLLIYDSFTVTLAWLLEETGFAGKGEAGAQARGGAFDRHGPRPLNPHGGLLSYGHCGVAGGMAQLVEAYLQAAGQAGERQMKSGPSLIYAHGDGGVMSAHVGLVLEAQT